MSTLTQERMGVSTAASAREEVWKSIYSLSYRAYFAEFLTERALAFWRLFDRIASILSAVAAGSSAVAAWSLWNQAGGREVWALVAGAAALVAIIHSKIGVKLIIKDLQRTWKTLVGLRIESQLLLTQVSLEKDHDEAITRLKELHTQLENSKTEVGPRLIRPPRRYLMAIQDNVDVEMHAFLGKRDERTSEKSS